MHCVQLLLVLSNPEGTPIHTFCAKYDLRHLSPNSKTMLRQRVTAAPKPPPPTDGPVECDAPQLPRSQVCVFASLSPTPVDPFHPSKDVAAPSLTAAHPLPTLARSDPYA